MELEVTYRDAIMAASALASLARELENDEIKQALVRVSSALMVADTLVLAKVGG